MIEAIYIISRTGIPVYFYDRTMGQEDVLKATLFSGIISAIQSLLRDINVGEATELSTRTNEIFLGVSEDFGVALILSKKTEYDKLATHKMLSSLINEIAFRYGEIPEANLLTPEEEKLLSEIIDSSISAWERDQKESNASKKLKDTLW